MDPHVDIAIAQMPAISRRRPQRRFVMEAILSRADPGHKDDESPPRFADYGLQTATLGEQAGSMRSTPDD